MTTMNYSDAKEIEKAMSWLGEYWRKPVAPDYINVTSVSDALALLEKLGAEAQDNFLSQQLNTQADGLVEKMSGLSGNDFDKFYAENELGYHQAVNGLVEGTFIPNLQNAEVKALFEQALQIFKAHEKHAEKMVASLSGK